MTLSFTWWGSDSRAKITQDVIAAFEKKYPNIKVTGQFKDWNGYWDLLATRTAANDAPDVMQMDELYLASYAGWGVLLDLGQQSQVLNTAKFDKTALATGQFDGKQYALPVGLSMYSVLANTDLLKQYGVDLPDDKTWTWDDLDRIGQQVTKASGGKVNGVGSWGFDTGSLNIWARQNGSSLYGPDGKVTINPAVLSSFWTYLLKISEDGAAPKSPVTVERQAGGLKTSGMATNKVAFATGWNTQLTSYQAASGKDLVLLRCPGESAAQARGPYYKPSMYWAVSSWSKHPKEAAEFVNFLANDPDAAKVMLTDRGIPANSEIRTAIAPNLKATDKAAADYLNTVEVGQTPTLTPNGASSIETIVARYTQQVLFKRTTPDAAASAFIKELQGEIDAAGSV